MCCPLGPISKRLEIRLEDRFEYELERALHPSVADRRNQRTRTLPPSFGISCLRAGSGWSVARSARPVAARAEPPRLRLDGLEGDPVNSRCPIVLLGHRIPARRVSILQTWTYRPQKRQDGSAFALTYILRLRSCTSMDAFIISSFFPMLETLQMQGPFAPRTLLRFIATTHPPPPSRLRPTSRFRRLTPTLLRRFLAGTRRASPVAQHVLATVLSLPPRQGEQPCRSDFGCSCCLRPTVAGSALGDSHFEATTRSLLLRPGNS